MTLLTCTDDIFGTDNTNISRNFKACLMTTADDAQTGVWPALQHAAHQQPINLQRIVSPNAGTVELEPYLNILIALHCQLIITAGNNMTPTLAAVAKAHPNLKFANVSTTKTGLPNVIDQTDQSQPAIATLLRNACGCQ